MATEEPGMIAVERSLGRVITRWLPAITAVLAALATIIVALFSWNAARSATDKDYVSLSMNILSAKDSSIPSRRWAVEVLSRLSPVDIPKDLASGLITGQSVIPSDLDPAATRRQISACLRPVLESEIAKPVSAAPLPKNRMTVGDLAVFGVQQTGQLEIANLRIDALDRAIDICITSKPVDKSTQPKS